LFNVLIVGALVLVACAGEETTIEAPVEATQPQVSEETPVEAQPTAAVEQPTAEVQQPLDTPAAPIDAQGQVVADLGFRPEVNGFSFENYGNDTVATNLTPADVQRMFGDRACASLKSGQCILVPQGRQWMDEVNQAMDGGHCEGLAALSLIFYTRKEDASKYGASVTHDLSLAGNQPLQEDIAYYWATQGTSPTQDGEIKDKTPSQILDLLIEAYTKHTETYTLGLYMADGSGGHAITPFAVEDRGNSKFAILVYDNNYPGVTRYVEVDRNSDSWRYSGSTNPSEPADDYVGDASTFTLSITPTSPRLQQQQCPFCDQPSSSKGGKSGLAQTAPQYNQLWLEGNGNLLITDGQGRRVGYVDGQFVQEIPEIQFQRMKLGKDVWDANPEPIYFIPVGLEFTVILDGAQIKDEESADLVMIGPGYALAVEGILLDPDQQDTVTFAPDGTSLSYQTTSTESPNFAIDIETDAADYSFETQGVDLPSGGVVNLQLDAKAGRLSLNTTGNTDVGTYDLLMTRYDDAGESSFYHDGITLDPNDTVNVLYADWTGDGGELTLELDAGSDGTIDDSVVLTDEQQQ
jgi:hypothetical protein